MSVEQQELAVLLDLLRKTIIVCTNIQRNPFSNVFIRIGVRILRYRLIGIEVIAQKMLKWTQEKE